MRRSVALALAVVFLAACRSGSGPQWEIGQDGFEHAYLKQPNGPVYVKRQVRADGCTFGDFPDDQPPTEVRVACGVVWTGTFGQRLTCVCADTGR